MGHHREQLSSKRLSESLRRSRNVVHEPHLAPKRSYLAGKPSGQWTTDPDCVYE
jgi:hypothetical protein